MKKLLFIIICVIVANSLYAREEAWVGEWVTLKCPEATVPFGWEAAIMHSYVWSVASYSQNKVTLSRLTTPSIAVTPTCLYEGEVTITVKHSFYLTRVLGGKSQDKASSETHTFRLACKKVNISLYPSELDLYIGESYPLQYSYDTSQSNPPVSTSFFSDNDNIASVDFNGVVYAKGIGESVITAKTNYGTYSSCKINVLPIDVQQVSLTPLNINLFVDQTASIKASIIPQNATNTFLEWHSSDEGIVGVDKTGFIKALKPGGAEIKAVASSGVFGCCYVTVLPIEVAYIQLEKNYIELSVGECFTNQVSIIPENATYKALNWFSSDPLVAGVDNEGRIEGISNGVAIINVEANNGMSAKCNVLVKDRDSSIPIIKDMENKEYHIYTLMGENLGRRTLSSLAKGVYVIKWKNGKYEKFQVH